MTVRTVIFKGKRYTFDTLEDLDKNKVAAFLVENPNLIVVREASASAKEEAKKKKFNAAIVASGVMENGKIDRVIYSADDIKIKDLDTRFPNKDEVVTLEAPTPGSDEIKYKALRGSSNNSNVEPGSSNNSNVEPGSFNNRRVVPGSSNNSNVEPGSSNNRRVVPGSSNNSNVEPGSSNNAGPGSAVAAAAAAPKNRWTVMKKRNTATKGGKRHAKKTKKQKKTKKGKKRN